MSIPQDGGSWSVLSVAQWLTLCLAGLAWGCAGEPPIKLQGSPNEVTPTSGASRDFSAIQAVTLENALPGRPIPFFIKVDEGDRHLVAGMVLNVTARGEDTGDLYETMTWTGGQGSGLPMHSFSTAFQALYLMKGELELWLNEDHYLMHEGDYASIPPGVPFAFAMRAHRTKVLNWASGGTTVSLMQVLGEDYQGHVQPEGIAPALSEDKQQAAEVSGELVWTAPPPETPALTVTQKDLPEQAVPYVLASGEGERYVAGDQMFTYLGDMASTGGTMIALMNEGPIGDAVPPHYHGLQTETFIPLEGSLTMIGNQQTLLAEEGDIVHVPAGTIHSYQLNDHYTQFLGFLAPAEFDDFFRTLGDPYAPYVYPQNPGPLRFDRIIERIDEVDLYLVGSEEDTDA